MSEGVINMASKIDFDSTPFDDHPLWALRAPAYWVAIPLVALAYASAAGLSLMLAIPPGYATAVWPPAGIALAAWLAFGSRIWPGILLGAALANLGVAGTTPVVALAIGLGNTAEAAAAGLLLRRYLALRHRFERPAAVWAFAAIAFGAAAIAATSGVTTLALAGQVRWADFGAHWLTWWLGDATGIVIVAPLLLAWSEPGVGRTAGEKRIEVQLFAALLALCAALMWAVRFPADTVQKLAYLMIPLVTWAAARLDQRAVTAASFAISVLAIVDMLDGVASMFAPMPLNESLLMLQLFVSLVALVGLTLSTLAGEVVRINAKLEASRSELQGLLTERTGQLEQTLAQQALLARRMVRIRDEERRRLAADLHDVVAQDVTSLGVSLDLIRSERRSRGAKWFDERVDEALAITQRAGKSLRELISGLHPPGLEGVALASALRRHAAEIETRTGILVSVQSLPSRDMLPLNIKNGLLRICLEAMNNAAKHADATSIRVSLWTDANATQLIVQDDGRGFDPGAARPHNGPSGAGLLIMRERAIAIGGQFRLQSAPGTGTMIECMVPGERGARVGGSRR
jgi:two-component system, NarL family, sensor histidine kinase FusK